jgi:hypothetical protein
LISILPKIGPLDEAKRTGIVDAILVEVLQKVREEQDRYNSEVNLSKSFLRFRWVNHKALVVLVRFVRVVEL